MCQDEAHRVLESQDVTGCYGIESFEVTGCDRG